MEDQSPAEDATARPYRERIQWLGPASDDSHRVDLTRFNVCWTNLYL